MGHQLKELMKTIIETSEESTMLTWETKVREEIEEKIAGMGEDRKIKWLQNKIYLVGGSISGFKHNSI